jgi:hypothetical protein
MRRVVPAPSVENMTTSSRRLLRAACAVGFVHAAFSLYWALGGRWLLDTVGQWAVDRAHTAPVAAGAALVLVAVVKVGGSVVPLLVEEGRLPGRRWWRRLSAGGAVVLLGYGLLNTVVAWAVLSGAIEVSGAVDRPALLGHAVLWDPLFALWGGLLAAGLWTTRTSRPVVRLRGTSQALAVRAGS